MEEETSKYSLVTGEKIKKKTIKKIKKEHARNGRKEEKDNKKLNKKIKKVDRKLKVEPSEKDLTDAAPSEKTNQTKVLIVRKQDNEVPVTPKRKVLNLLSYLLVGIVAVFFGYFAGNFYVANYMNKVDYSAFSEAGLMADAKQVYLDFIKSTKNPYGYKDSEGQFRASDIFLATEYVMGTLDYYRADIEGQIQPSIGSAQKVWGYKTKNQNIYSYENLSVGMLSVGEKVVYDSTKQQAEVYPTTKLSLDNVQYKDTPNVLSLEEYRQEYGTNPTVPFDPYIINRAKTVLPGTEVVSQQSNNLYQLDFFLTTDSSVINYIKQVKHMSGLKDYPTFKSVHVTAVVEYNPSDVGKELKFVSIKFDESYTVIYVGVVANCSGYVMNTFSYN